uniref:Uncharacterized protein n=1 Tax=Podoviridae sp. ctnWS46 TaxID=2827747 RepID=A0A8S5SZV2_9CAUD|nr:MAG TPA: hypothetical protein [Podoviridae sp. ctnWS46]
MTKLQQMMNETKQLEGFEENSALLFDYTWTCEKIENGVEDDGYRKYLLDQKVKLRYEILKRMAGNK